MSRTLEPLPIDALLRGRYEISALLDRRAFSATYRAVDREGFGRTCILKELIPGDEGDAKVQQAFEREARLLADLSHPAIPRLLAYFSEGGRHYLVQEHVEGQIFADIVRARGPLPEAEVLAVMKAALEALDYLHGRSPAIIHRSIQPESLIRTETGSVLITDFGAVREAVTRPGHTMLQTTVAATSGYSPPEQLRGQAHPASDLYALGATALHLLTGLAPGKLYDANRGQWRLDRATISPRLRTILERMTAESLAARYRTAGEVLRELRAPLDVEVAARRDAPGATAVEAPLTLADSGLRDGSGQPTSVVDEERPTPAHTVRWPRNRARIGVAAVALIGLGLWFWPAKDRAIQPAPESPRPGITVRQAPGGDRPVTDQGGPGPVPRPPQPRPDEREPSGFPRVDLREVNAARARLTEKTHNTVGQHLILEVSYPPGWVPQHLPGGIQVRTPDEMAAYEMGYAEGAPNLTPDVLFHQRLLPAIKQKTPDVEVLGSAAFPHPTDQAKKYLLTGTKQGRRLFAEIVLFVAQSQITFPGAPPLPSLFKIVAVSGTREHLATLYAIAEAAREVPIQAGVAPPPYPSGSTSGVGGPPGDRNADWQLQQEERRARDAEWRDKRDRYIERGKDWQEDKRTYKSDDRGFGKPDPRLYPEGKPFKDRRN